MFSSIIWAGLFLFVCASSAPGNHDFVTTPHHGVSSRTSFIKSKGKVVTGAKNSFNSSFSIKLDGHLVNGNTVSLKWTRIKNIKFYTVCYISAILKNCEKGKIIKSFTNNTRIDKLLPSTPYEFRVRAHMTDGFVGPFSNPFKITTYNHGVRSRTRFTTQKVRVKPDANNSSKSIKVTGHLIGEDAVSLNWTNNSKQIQFYTVCYVPAGVRNCEKGNIIKSFTTKVKIDKLLPNTTYEFRVRSHMANGAVGPFSNPFKIKTPYRIVWVDNPPKIVKVDGHLVNENSISLSWTSDSKQIQFYTVCYVPTGVKNCEKRNTIKSFTTKATIDKLLPNTTYEFRVRSHMANGVIGPFSNPFKIKTPYRIVWVDNPPKIVKVDGHLVNENSVSLSWTSDSKQIQFYTVCYVAAGVKNCENGNTIKSFTTKVKIDKLLPSTTYEFRVRSHMANGVAGPFSNPFKIKTPGVPSPVMELKAKIINASAVCLSWYEPLHKNGKISNYIISYTPNNDWPWKQWTNVSIPTNQIAPAGCWKEQWAWFPNQDFISVVLANLQANTRYNVSVRAVSNVGIGHPALPIIVNTTVPAINDVVVPQNNVPSPVMELKAEIINASAVCLSWYEPLHKNGQISNYIISYAPIIDLPWTQCTNVSILTNQTAPAGCWKEQWAWFPNQDFISVVLANLQPNTRYNVSVRAVSNVGIGHPALPIIVNTTVPAINDVVVPQNNVPSPVMELKAEIINASAVCLSWYEPLHKNGQISNYIISYAPIIDLPWTQCTNVSILTNQTAPAGCWKEQWAWFPNQDFISVVLANLQPNTRYNVSVRAVSNVGIGHPALPIIVNTTVPAINDVVPQNNVPSPVMELKAKIINASAVCLSWYEPLHKNGQISNYIISYAPIIDLPWTQCTNVLILTNQTASAGCWKEQWAWFPDQDFISVVLANLQANTRYNVSVRAVSNVGIGHPTIPIIVDTSVPAINDVIVPQNDSKFTPLDQQRLSSAHSKLAEYYQGMCFAQTGENDAYSKLFDDATDFISYFQDAVQILPKNKKLFCLSKRKNLNDKMTELSRHLNTCLRPSEKYLSDFIRKNFGEFLYFLCRNNEENIDKIFSLGAANCRKALLYDTSNLIGKCFSKIAKPFRSYITKSDICNDFTTAEECSLRVLDEKCHSYRPYKDLLRSMFRYVSVPCAGCTINNLNTVIFMLPVLLFYIIGH